MLPIIYVRIAINPSILSFSLIRQNGQFKDHGLNSGLNNKKEGLYRQDFLELQILKENIDALDIYWFVTFDTKHKDLPRFVEGL